jgi:hypothetical protein
MKWDGHHYVRGQDKLLWNDGQSGARYTPEEFVSAPNVMFVHVFTVTQRRYWVGWMVKTEYEAQLSKQAISKADCQNYLKGMGWWYDRD